MSAITPCQRTVMYFGNTTGATAEMLNIITTISITEAYRHPVNILWIIPASLVANLLVSAMATLAAAVIVVAIPVFLITALCQQVVGNRQSRNFWLDGAAGAPFGVFSCAFTALKGVMGTFTLMETLSRELESLPSLEENLIRFRASFR